MAENPPDLEAETLNPRVDGICTSWLKKTSKFPPELFF